MPAAGAPAKFTIFFGGGAGYTPAYERMWDVIKRHEPLAYLALGDNVYIDTPEVQATQQYCYYRRQSRSEYRRLVASTPVFAIWDDHDFVVNDGEGGPAIDHPPWKRAVWQTFCNNFVNPAYGGGAEQPGCWFTCSIAEPVCSGFTKPPSSSTRYASPMPSRIARRSSHPRRAGSSSAPGLARSLPHRSRGPRGSPRRTRCSRES